ncbi:hypothetical protein [Moorena sp. SIO4G3]|uniref:hypothetical protein n=1 Tax=Moorena sp. SIO4G3 TaxID=2607821 RepID=UPI00142A8D4B|nr:hypothetical protein [Moorena sp. SIO4G3]NEO81824.1 hypothetical protein [Moorena sp. SIO4G3]
MGWGASVGSWTESATVVETPKTSLLPRGASNFCCLTWWCVTGRTVPKLPTEKMRASPSLTHPTQLNLCSRLPTPDSRLPIPDSRFPTPDSLLPTPYSLVQLTITNK